MTVRGFTLLEMLVGLAIFALVAGGLFGVLGGVLRLDKRIRSVHDQCQQVRSTFEVMDRDLENAIPYPFDKARSDRLAFEGSESAMAFFVGTGRGIQEVKYYSGDMDFSRRSQVRVRRVKSVRESFDYEKGVGERVYFVRRTLALADILAGHEDQGFATALATNLAKDGLHFSYGVFIGDKPGQLKVTFQNEWKDNRLPDVVRIEMTVTGSAFSDRGVTARRDFYLVVKDPVL